MRKLLFGLFGFAALGFGALAAQPAEAQPYHPGYRHYHRPPPVMHHHRPVHRHYRRAHMAPRCFVRPERIWTAYGWRTRPVRVCRY